MGRPAPDTPMAPLSIYIVEDSSVIRENLIDAMRESAPIEIAGCADDERGATAWLAAGANECDLVIATSS
jgi:DNA-binding NarL/FixJ family response regulator